MTLNLNDPRSLNGFIASHPKLHVVTKYVSNNYSWFYNHLGQSEVICVSDGPLASSLFDSVHSAVSSLFAFNSDHSKLECVDSLQMRNSVMINLKRNIFEPYVRSKVDYLEKFRQTQYEKYVNKIQGYIPEMELFPDYVDPGIHNNFHYKELVDMYRQYCRDGSKDELDFHPCEQCMDQLADLMGINLKVYTMDDRGDKFEAIFGGTEEGQIDPTLVTITLALKNSRFVAIIDLGEFDETAESRHKNPLNNNFVINL